MASSPSARVYADHSKPISSCELGAILCLFWKWFARRVSQAPVGSPAPTLKKNDKAPTYNRTKTPLLCRNDVNMRGLFD